MLPIPLPMKTRASNAALAKARAMYGRRLTAADYKRLAACRTMPALAAELKALPMYEEALKTVNPPTARRAQLEAFLRQAIFDRYDSLCRYELSSGHLLYGYFTTSCEVDEILSCLRCLDAGRPGDYLYKLPDFLQLSVFRGTRRLSLLQRKTLRAVIRFWLRAASVCSGMNRIMTVILRTRCGPDIMRTGRNPWTL